MTRLRRLLPRVLLLAVAAGLLAGVGLLAWLGSAAGGRFVARRLEEAAAARGVELAVEGLRIEPLRLGATADRLTVAVPGETGVRLDARGARLRLAARGLLAGRIRPRVLTVEGLDLEVARGEGAGAASPPGGAAIDPGLLADLEHLAVREGTIRWEDRRVPFSLDVRGIRLPGIGRPGSRGGGLAAGPVRARYGSGDEAREFALDSIACEWSRPSENEILLKRIRAEGPGVVLREGELSVTLVPDGVEFTGKGRVEVDPAPFAPGFVEGMVAADLAVRGGTPGWWSVDARLGTGSVPLRIAGHRVGSLSGTVRASGERVALEGLSATVDGLGELAGLTLAREPGTGWEGRGEAMVDLAGLAEGRLPPWLPLAGRGRVEVRVRPDGPRVEWTGTLAGALAGVPLEGSVRGNLSPGGGEATVGGSWGGAPFSVDLRLDGAPGPGASWRARLAGLSVPREGVAHLLGLAEEAGFLPPGGASRLGARSLRLGGVVAGRGPVLEGVRLFATVARPRIGRTRWHLLEGEFRLEGGDRWRATGRLADAWGDGIVATALGGPGRPPRLRATAREVPSALAAAFLPAVSSVEELTGPWTLDGALDVDLDPFTPAGTVVASGRGVGRGAPRARLAVVRAPGGRGSGLVAAAAPGFSLRGQVELGPGASPAGPDVPALVRAAPLVHVAARPERFTLLPLPVDVRGAVRLDLAGLREDDGRWTAAGGLAWDDLAIAGRHLPAGSAELEAIPGGFAAETSLAELRGRLEVSGLPDSPRGDLLMEARDLPVLARLADLEGKPPPSRVDVRLDGKLAVTGPLLDPGAWQGKVDDLVVRVRGAGLSLASAAPATVVLREGRVELPDRTPLHLVDDQGSSLVVSGSVVSDPAGPRIDGTVEGRAPLGLLETLLPDLLAAGTLEAELHARGPLAAPELDGHLAIRDGRVRHLPSGIAVDRVELEVAVGDGLARITRGTALLGGGNVTAGGRVSLDGWRPGTVDLFLSARDVALAYPEDFFGRYDVELRLGGAALSPEVRGKIELLAGRYTGPLGFLSGGRQRRRIAPALRQRGPLSRIGLDLEFVADESLMVRNDIAELLASTRVRVTGNAGAPELSGTVTLLEGGRFSLRGLDYRILSGQVIVDDPRGQPVHLVARGETRIQGYRILFNLDASEDSLDYHLSSIPALSEQDILLLLITGRTSAELGSSGADQVGEAAGTYFGSQLGELLIAGPARRYLGITQFQVAPSRVGPEARPSARVTLGKRVDERTMVVYSRDLSSEGNDLYRVERDLSRSLQLSLGKDPLGGFGIDLRWLRRLGAGPVEESTEPMRLRRARFVGWPRELRKPRLRRLGILRHAPDGRALRLQFRDAVRRELILGGYLEPRVTVRSEAGRKGRFTLVAEVEPGPRYRVEMLAPRRIARVVRGQLADLWATTEFRPALMRDAERVVRRGLARKGHATATVDLRYVPGDPPAVLVQVDAGPVVRVARVRYEGARNVPLREIEQQVLSRPGGLLERRPVLDPQVVDEDARAIEALYASRGYLAARVEPRTLFSLDGGSATVVFHVDEGPLARIGTVRVAGEWPSDVLGPATARLGLAEGDPFEQERVVRARRELLRLLDDHGWYHARVEVRSSLRGTLVDVEFVVQPGERAVVGEVAIEGIRRTRRRLVERNVPFTPGEPLRSADLHAAERNLFRLGLFREVDIDTEPLPGRPGRRRVVIRVTESPPKTVFLQAGYDTEEKVRAAVGFSAENVGGMGRVASLWLFRSSLRRVVRMTFEDRHLGGGTREGLLSLDSTREERDGFTLDGWSATVQLGTHPVERRRWQVRYVLEQHRFLDVTLSPDAVGDILWDEGRRVDQQRLGGIVLDLARDHRDDPFLPGKGSLWRWEVGLWSGLLASDADFALGKVQWVGYHGWGRLTGVLSLRAGVSVPFGDTERVPLSRRFFAGGADTLRGFARDDVGPRDRPGGHPIGGEALGIANVEARWRLTEHLELVAFHDVGNTWRTAEDFGSGFRRTVGLGVRLRTPIGPVRLEYGHVLDRREGESPGRFYFSIGEPF